MSEQSKSDALLLSVSGGNINVVQQLLSEGADVNYINEQGEFALYTACSNGDVDMTALLLKNRAQINLQDNKGWFSLMRASHNGHVEVARLLLENGATIDLQNKNGASALYIASQNGHVKVAKLLLESHAKVDLQSGTGKSALYIASQNGHTSVAKLLLENGATVDLQRNSGASALYIASQRGHIAVAKLLLKNGANIDLQKNSGATALYIASQKGHVEVAKLLLEKGASIDLQKNIGASALYIASEKGHVEVAKLLVENGAKIDLREKSGACALHVATQNGHIEVVKLLIKKHAQVDLTYNRLSPLMIACECGLSSITQVLLDHDADTYLRNNKGQTALEIAKEKNHVDIIALFADLKEKATYPGILFSEGVKKESITSDKRIINLEEVGISLTFPENSLPSNEPTVEVAIQPCFSGSFIMPDDVESMSPAYVIKPNRKITFQKDVVLKIRHYANLQTEEDCEDMVFLSASSTPEYRGSTPVYVFKEIKKARTLFRLGQDQPVGEILLKHFCATKIGKRKRKNSGSKEGVKRHKALYSARLFRTEKSAVFCMCLYQPLYMQHCENVIASKYSLKDDGQGPIEYNAVTLSSYEVSINISDNNDWTTYFPKNPKISRTEIEIQEFYHDKFKDLLRLSYPPRIDISVSLTPVTPNPKPLELRVEGLNSECIFKLLPGDYIAEVNTTPISYAIKELHEELVTESESCNSTIFAEATKMMEYMVMVEPLIRIQNPTTAITTSVIQTLVRMEGTCKQLKNAAKQELQQLRVTYDMENHIEAVDTRTRQLRVIYGANIKHISGNVQAATQLFITNSANLMDSIKEVIKSSKLARALPHNQLLETPSSPNVLTRSFTALPFSLANLLLMKWKDVDGNEHTFSLLDKVSSEWQRVGIMLGITMNKLKGWDRQHFRDVTMCWGELMEHWKNSGGTSNYPPSWDGLYKLLCDIQYSKIAENMKKAVNQVQNS